ncbi:MAG: pyridoxal-phosphate dependent enzyme [Planctomycetota bacterium]
MTKLAITPQDVEAAAQRLAGVALRTPVLQSPTFDEAAGCRVFFKCESFQRGGAFKFRGAYNTLSQLTPADRANGVVGFSSGNHAQGVACAAQLLGICATIVMPSDAPPAKLEGTRGFGAEVILYDRQTEDREEIAGRIATERGATLVPPFDHPHIMAGQGTVALELLEEVPDLDAIVVPVGGGGLLSGCATIARARKPAIEIWGVETERSNDWWQSLQSGTRVKIDPPDTIADGMRTQQPGRLTFPVVQALANGIVLVSEDEVLATMHRLISNLKCIVEPTGAVPAAAVLFKKIALADKRVAIVLSGGNADRHLVAELLRSGSLV